MLQDGISILQVHHGFQLDSLKMSVIEAQRKFLGTLWNVYSFYVLYANLDNFNPIEYDEFKSENVMDKWIMSKLKYIN